MRWNYCKISGRSTIIVSKIAQNACCIVYFECWIKKTDHFWIKFQVTWLLRTSHSHMTLEYVNNVVLPHSAYLLWILEYFTRIIVLHKNIRMMNKFSDTFIKQNYCFTTFVHPLTLFCGTKYTTNWFFFLLLHRSWVMLASI